MHSYLLKKLLPFTLTFVVGAFIGGLFKTYRTARTTYTLQERVTPLLGHEGPFGYGYDRHRSCRMYRRDLLAETRPLVILFKPEARYTPAPGGDRKTVRVNVTFGADGEVKDVQQIQTLLPQAMLEAVERAARQIKFEPETINSVPVSVEKEVEIHLMGGD